MYSRECSTYWCDSCGKEMDVDYKRSNEHGIALQCKGCDCWRCFAAIDNENYELVIANTKEVEDGEGRLETAVESPKVEVQREL